MLMSSDFKLNPAFDGRAPSATLLVNEAVAERWARGEHVLQLGFGESRFAVHPKLQAAITANAARKSYLPARGLPELCSAVASYHSESLGLSISPHQVIIGPGSKPLIYSLQLALDATLLLPVPAWVSYAPQAQLLSRPVFHIPSRAADNYRFDLNSLKKAVRAAGSAQKLLVLNSPNNPTGQMLDETQLEEIATFCRRKNILILSDEIYSRIQYDDVRHCSIAKYYPEGTIIVGGLSKHLSIGGWRLGVAIVPDTSAGENIMSALQVVGSEIWSCVASPVQYAAVLAYSGDADIEDYIDRCSAIHGVRTRFLRNSLRDLGIKCTEAKGAFYVTANFDRWKAVLLGIGVRTSSELAKYLLDRHSIATLSADSFGLPEETLSLRLATCYLDMEKDSDSARLLDLRASGLSDEELMSREHHPNSCAAVEGYSDFIASLES
jgi:aspartate/methionine/tyrosine aminotransferase